MGDFHFILQDFIIICPQHYTNEGFILFTFIYESVAWFDGNTAYNTLKVVSTTPLNKIIHNEGIMFFMF